MTASTALLGIGSAGVAAAAPSCTPNVGGSGLSAAVVAHAHQAIAHRTIDATGCDIGIYVGSGAADVTIKSVRVSGANFEGIFAEKTSHLTIENSTVTGNGFNTIDSSAPPLPGSGVHSYVGQSFAISLFGVSDSTVKGNRVYNNGRGGIGVMDNGPNDPGALTQDMSAPLLGSTHDVIVDNQMWANYNGCALVAATQNVGGHLSDLVLAGNRIAGTTDAFTSNGPDIGGIVVAADLPNSSVTDVTVRGNKVRDSFEGGVMVNAEAFNSFTRDVYVVGNTVSGNDWGHLEVPTPNTAGVIVFANPQADVPPDTQAPANIDTVVAFNNITEQYYGIVSTGNYRPATFWNHIKVTSGGTPIF